MKILYSWLKDYVNVEKDPKKLADDLSMFAHEVESIQEVGDDAILDLEITPNRGDCLSHLGIARQVAAMYALSLNMPEYEINEEEIDKNIRVEIEKDSICPRYTARIIDNIEIKDSPKWMQDRLIAYGFRPINNIVDITNYVMLATGQPLHAFDYDKIKDGLMRVRLSKDGEEVVTLDGKNHKLSSGVIIIEDDEKIYDLAGIMGGDLSQVDQNTKTIVLQGSIFDSVLVRRASKYLHHQTDASYRYERGVDIGGTVYSVDMAASLIKENISDAKIGKLIDINKVTDNQTIEFNDDKINGLIGTSLSPADITSFLQRLHFKVENNVAEVPSFRIYDVAIWQDLAEEVARVYGYNNIERIQPVGGKPVEINSDWIKRALVSDKLKDLGFTEIYSYSFADKDKISSLGYKLEDCPEIINPISPETQYLRPTLMISLLSAIARNPWAPDVNIFEIEKSFYDNKEFWQLAIATTGKSDSLIKSAIKEIGLDIEIVNVEQKILDQYKVRRPVKIIVVDFENVPAFEGEVNYEISKNKLKPISKYPPTVRDLAFIVDTTIDSSQIEKSILEASSAVLLTENFDEFTSDKFGQGKKNVAFHIWIQKMDGSVSEEESNEIINNVIQIIENKYQAKLRA